MPSKDTHQNFALMRERILAEQDGQRYWRSLEELADTPEFREFVEREYPQHAEEWHDPIGRRNFIKLMGASLALAGLSACAYQPPEKIVPYVDQPEELVPGKPLFFATAMPMGGTATPLLVRSNEGRPTKVEGNPDHPNNRGADLNVKGTSATDLFAQASILTDFPAAKWHQYEPAGRAGAQAGSVAAFGEPVNTLYRFDQAERILAID